MTTAISTDKESNLDLPEESYAQLSKIMPGAFEPAVQKRIAEPIVALQSKKLKVDSLVQTLQMNGIMSVCGVNMTEEEIGMLPKLTAERRSLVEEERDELFLEKKPLQDKLIKLANDWGVSFVNEDVELCLSLSIEELFRSILNRLIKCSDQDMVKGNPKLLVTSDVGAQIRMLRQKAREALKAKELAGQKQAENLYNENKKVMEVEAAPKLKSQTRKNKEENVSKVISLQTVETDKMLIKWQIMAEEARLKRENKAGTLGNFDNEKKASTLPAADSGKKSINFDNEKKASTLPAADPGRPPGINSQLLTEQPKKSISVNDLISVLEMDSNMAKSTLLYQFYDRVHTKLQK